MFSRTNPTFTLKGASDTESFVIVSLSSVEPEPRPMSLFDQINARITANLQQYGHYLTDPHASEEAKIAETVDILIEFVRPA